MKQWYYKDEIYCYWIFIWACLSFIFPKYYPFYPSFVTSIVVFVAGFIIATSSHFTSLAKLILILYHSIILLGFYALNRKHNICVDILIFIMYMVYYLIKYKRSPYYTYVSYFKNDKTDHLNEKISSTDLIFEDNISK